MSHVTDRTALLLTRGCTTGMHDWIHGELWLFPDGLLRVRLGLLRTIAHGFWPTVDRHHPLHRSFDEATFNALVAQKRNRWIPAESIRGVTFQGASAQLALQSGKQAQLLWVPWDQVRAPLANAINTWTKNALGR